jgi:phage replication O-like protein O
MSKKPTIKEPNYTQVPNVLLDEIMLGMDKSKLLVMFAICRQTFGWHRDCCQLSLSDLQKLTGLGRQSVKNGVDALVEDGYLSRDKIGQSFTYSLIVQPEDQSNGWTSKESNDETGDSPADGLAIVQPEDQSKHAIKEKETKTEKENNNKQTVVVADPSLENQIAELSARIEAAGKGKATDAGLRHWVKTYTYERVLECVGWYEKGVAIGKIDTIGWLADCLLKRYERPSWMTEAEPQPEGWERFTSGKYGSQIDTGDDFPEPPPDPAPEPEPPAPDPVPVIVEFTQPLLPARVGTHNLLALVAESMGDLPAVEQPAIRQTSAPKLAVVEGAPPNGNGHRRIFEPKKPSEEERERMAQMVEEAQARLVAKLGKPTVKRKPGEPDMKHAGGAPVTAGMHELKKPA